MAAIVRGALNMILKMSRCFAATITLALLLAEAGTSYAWDQLHIFQGCEGRGVRWSRNPTFYPDLNGLRDIFSLIYPQSFPNSLREATFKADLLAVIIEINGVGGSGIRLGYGFSDPVPVDFLSRNNYNEIGYTLLFPTAAARTDVVHDSSTCEIIEADVQLDVINKWAVGTPYFNSEPYYQAGLCTNFQSGMGCGDLRGSANYVRSAVLHELLHALGFAHNTQEESFLNYGALPWMNGQFGELVTPLPDDRAGIRQVYGNGTRETDVTVNNSALDQASQINIENHSIGVQSPLCKPSSGYGFSSSPFDEYCGDSSIFQMSGDPLPKGGTGFCPKDTLYARVSVANMSTMPADVTLELWLSDDEELDRRDYKTNAQLTRNLQASTSEIFSATASIPEEIDAGSYFIIARADAGEISGSEEDSENNWIPLRGTIDVYYDWSKACYRDPTYPGRSM